MSIYSGGNRVPEGVAGQISTQSLPIGVPNTSTVPSIFTTNTNAINASNIDVSEILYFKRYDINGDYTKYNQNTAILYNDTLYYSNTTTTGQNLPHDKSSVWKRLENVPNLYNESTTEPYGSKRSGDKWFNPSTNITYSYTKINNVYQWISG